MMQIPVGVNASSSAQQGRLLGVKYLADGKELSPDGSPMQRAARTGQAVTNFEVVAEVK
jgi:hypothetical protein